MILTQDNYYSTEANMAYMSASQFKAFDSCEAAALAEVMGEYTPKTTTAMLVGSYVDAYFDGTLDAFKEEHPDLFKRDGGLKSDYVQAEQIIRRVERDEMFMRYMSGEKQVIRTGEIAGVPWKIKMDSYHAGRAIVDLKVMKDFEKVYAPGAGKIPFVEAWGYDIQGAAYREIEGTGLPFFIAGVTKEKDEPDIEIIGVPSDALDAAMEKIIVSVGRYDAIKRGEIEPERCGHCAYCKSTKVLTHVVDYRDL